MGEGTGHRSGTATGDRRRALVAIPIRRPLGAVLLVVAAAALIAAPASATASDPNPEAHSEARWSAVGPQVAIQGSTDGASGSGHPADVRRLADGSHTGEDHSADACAEAKKKVKRAKRDLRRAKKSGNARKIKKAKKKLKRAKRQKRSVC